MKNKILILSIISLLVVLTLANATTIWNSDNVKSSYFREMIEVEKNDVWITDLFYITIPLTLSEEKIFISLTPPSKELGNNRNISEVNIKLCEYWNGINSEVSQYNLSLDCYGGELSKDNYEDDFHVNNFNLIEINSSKLNWSREIRKNQGKVIYVYVKYRIKDFIYEIEKDKEKTLWIRGLECDYNNPDCLTENVGMYIVFPDFYFIDGGQNYRLVEISKDDKKMFFIAKNAKEDVIFNFKDFNQENISFYFWFLAAITLGFSLSVVVSLTAPEVNFLPKKLRKVLIWIVAIISLILVAYTASQANIPTSIIALIIAILLIPVITLSVIPIKPQNYSNSKEKLINHKDYINSMNKSKNHPIVKHPIKVIIILGLVIILLWVTLNSFNSISVDKAPDITKFIIELSAVVAGFGLVGYSIFSKDKSEEINKIKISWLADLRESTLSALLSIMVGFIFLNYPDLWYSKIIFSVCVGLFFYSIILFFGFVWLYNPFEEK